MSEGGREGVVAPISLGLLLMGISRLIFADARIGQFDEAVAQADLRLF